MGSVRLFRSGVLPVIAALGAAATGGASHTAAPPHVAQSKGFGFQTCSLPDVARAALCGSFEAPENPAKPNGRMIRIALAILPATNGTGSADPIVPFMGGPGESAIESAAYHVERFAPLLIDRDLVLIDQRGAGRSSPLACPLTSRNDRSALLTDIFPAKAVAKCAAGLKTKADLTQYGFRNFARDVDYVRRKLGYGKLNLAAGSYGTRALQVFVRYYPTSVRTAFISSVVPIDIAAPATMAKTAADELERLLAACEADRRCQTGHPALRQHFGTIVNRLDRGEVRIRLPESSAPLVLHRGPVASWIRAQLYRPSSAAALPAAIDRAYRGDWSIITSGVLAGTGAGLNLGLFFAITCNEDIRFIDSATSAAGFLGNFRVDQQAKACRYWPTSPLPADYRTPLRSNIPTLFSTGTNDGGTPVSFTDRAARHFSKAEIVETQGQGHTEWNDCVAARYARLVRTGDVNGPRRRTCTAVPRPDFE